MFITHTLTKVGADMLAKAASGNLLIVEGCEASNTQYSEEDAQNLNYIDPQNYTTDINTAAMESQPGLNLRAQFHEDNGAMTGGSWYSVILFGRNINDMPNTRKPIAVLSSDELFYLPEMGATLKTADIVFSLGYLVNDNDVIVPSSTIYALSSEHQQLLDEHNALLRRFTQLSNAHTLLEERFNSMTQIKLHFIINNGAQHNTFDVTPGCIFDVSNAKIYTKNGSELSSWRTRVEGSFSAVPVQGSDMTAISCPSGKRYIIMSSFRVSEPAYYSDDTYVIVNACEV